MIAAAECARTSAAFRPVHMLAAEIAARRLSPVDVLDECLARIERLEPRLHAFVSVNAANARLAAEAADKVIRAGHAVGPLHGIPIVIKDLVEIEGEVAMGGTADQQHPGNCELRKADLREQAARQREHRALLGD
jgi:aspartyl-tRNA(Asn)/glutamyl-tRNA(Gln) amidotransferase subunit A